MAASVCPVHVSNSPARDQAVEGRLGRNVPRDEYVSPLMIDLAEELALKMRQEMELP